MFGLWEGTLVSPDDFWTMAAIIVGWATVSIVLEQKYAWASKVTGAIIALTGALILSNLNIIPIGSQFEDMVWGYVVPMAIPMLLFKANLARIKDESLRFLGIFLISSVGTVLGAMIAIVAIGSFMEQVPAVSAMMAGSYIGGSVNFAAMAESFQATDSVSSAAIVADNLIMVIYMMFLISVPAIPFFRKVFKSPLQDKIEADGKTGDGELLAAKYWGRKEISLKDIALTFAIAFAINAFAVIFTGFIKTSFAGEGILNELVVSFLGNKYLIITTVALLLATIFSKTFEDIKGSNEIGTFLIYIFFVVIGIPASISQLIQNAVVLLFFALIMVIINMLVTFVGAKVFNFTLEETIIASNANIGGPTTAAALAISKGWDSLVAPVIIVGTLGYVIGNYAGIFIHFFATALNF